MVWLAALIGATIGTMVTILCNQMLFMHGTLRIDHSNPDKDVYRFEINDLDGIRRKKRITLKIDHNADLSHK